MLLQRGGDAALRRDRVRAGREDLGDAGGLQALLGHAERGAQAGAAGADDDDVEGVVDIGVGLAGWLSCRVPWPIQPPNASLEQGEDASDADDDGEEGVEHRAAPSFSPSPWI